MTRSFPDFFPNTKYRYLDLSGNNRPPVTSDTLRPDLNGDGYDSFFTVNGFAGSDAKKENCINLNAFFVDIDRKMSTEEIQKIRAILEPTLIVETFHGYHFYWCLDEIIYKEESPNWDALVTDWEDIEQAIVDAIPDADKHVKDLPRILRTVNSIYWKKTDGFFIIQNVHIAPACVYSFAQVREAFPRAVAPVVGEATNEGASLKRYAEDERQDFFNRVNKEFPIEHRDSFKALISGKPGTVLPNTRNAALLITVSLMKQAKWSRKQVVAHLAETGWHGMEAERGGPKEIETTINSAFANNYTYSYKNEIIARNTTTAEQQAIQEAYANVAKQKKETDKVRFTNYEREILNSYPYLKKNEIGLVFNYEHGVYRLMSDMELSNIVLSGLYEDMLWNYRTKKNVSDKVACLLSIIPDLVLTEDNGEIFNLKNGLLNIYTRTLAPHTPEYVSLIQSPVSYEPTAKCPTWIDCLSAWMEGEEKSEKTTLLQQFSGYCLSSAMRYDRALFLIGDGGNGKSTFVDTIAMVIGKDSTAHIDLEGLYGQYGMKGLIGKRLNVVEEVHGNYYQSNKLKKLISGENVTIDIKYKDQFSFRPQAKFVFAVNIMPRVDDTSSAMERRICAILFKNNFRARPNTELRSDRGILASELPGILNWMLDGAQHLKEMGTFISTKEQTELLTEYRQENSSVEGFLTECVEFKEGATVPARDLYDEYKTFCLRDGRKFKSNIGFTKEMKAFGARFGTFQFMERRYGSRISYFEGMEIRSDWSKEASVNQEFRQF